MSYKINGKIYHSDKCIEVVTSKDSFTHPENKLGTANGSPEWHIGSKKSEENYEFFGGNEFIINCFVLKSDLVDLMEELSDEYQNPTQNYRKRKDFPELFNNRMKEIDSLEEYTFFQLKEDLKRRRTDPRLYARPNNTESIKNYTLLRKLTLPKITQFSIQRIKSTEGDILYYFKLFSLLTSDESPSVKNEVNSIQNNNRIKKSDKIQLINARIGQGKFRKELIEELQSCPFTGINDSRLLIASHIKPWKDSNNKDRLSTKNGLLLSPTMDKLFDRGFISFNKNKKLLISPWLTSEARKQLRLDEFVYLDDLPIQGREKYMEYHRNNVFQK